MFIVTTLKFVDDYKHADASCAVEDVFHHKEEAYERACGILSTHMRERIESSNGEKTAEMKAEWTRDSRTWKEFFTYLSDFRELWELSVEWFGPQNTMKTGTYVYVTEKDLPKFYTVTGLNFNDDYKRVDASCNVVGCYRDREEAFKAASFALADSMGIDVADRIEDEQEVPDDAVHVGNFYLDPAGKDGHLEKMKGDDTWEKVHERLSNLRDEMFPPEFMMMSGLYTEVTETVIQ